MEHIKLFEDFEDHYTFECSGSPMPEFRTKADFFDFMSKCGFKHTTLNKNTNMLIVVSKDFGSLKCQKAEKALEVLYYRKIFFRVKKTKDWQWLIISRIGKVRVCNKISGVKYIKKMSLRKGTKRKCKS